MFVESVLERFILYLATLVAAGLTLPAGFGLGTLLTPVFAFAYDVKLAVSLVAIIHLVNNLFKVGLFRKHVDFSIVRRFGAVSIVGALAGAYIQLSVVSRFVQVFLAVFLILFGTHELIPFKRKVRLPRKIDWVGGFLSGLLGGLIGNQGAIRSAYLLNYNLSKETFIATAIVIASVIDVTRIPVYVVAQHEALLDQWFPLFLLILVAMSGTLIGKRLLNRFSEEQFRRVVAAAIVAMGLLLLFTER